MEIFNRLLELGADPLEADEVRASYISCDMPAGIYCNFPTVVDWTEIDALEVVSTDNSHVCSWKWPH